MEIASEPAQRSSDPIGAPSTPGSSPGAGPVADRRATAWQRTALRLGLGTEQLRWVILVYLGTRALLLLVAIAEGALRHHSLLHELANWDGLWYRELANKGYPTHPSDLQTTLGFFPLYSVTLWFVGHILLLGTAHSSIWAITVAGLLVSGIGGLVATIIVFRLAAGWWGVQSARRATAFFCLFPGSVVFSMVYSEGLLIPLAAGCIFALQRRRWLLAGVLAGFATAVGPSALVLIPVCAVSALLELHRRGWRDRAARRSLLAPLVSLSGIAAFATFLWAWTGTPLATLQAQHHGWREKTDPLALVHLTTRLGAQINLSHFNQPTVNLNLVVGLIGAFVLLGMLVLLFRQRRGVSVEAIVWTMGIAVLAVTSEYVPPNPRMLITAFPAVLVVGHYLKGRAFTVLLWLSGVLLVVLSYLTFVGITVRP